jgi:hypothetical protein
MGNDFISALSLARITLLISAVIRLPIELILLLLLLVACTPKKAYFSPRSATLIYSSDFHLC